jgi:hypothetical protein
LGIKLHSWTLFWQSKSKRKTEILEKGRKNYVLATLPSAVQLKATFEALITRSVTKAANEVIPSISKR